MNPILEDHIRMRGKNKRKNASKEKNVLWHQSLQNLVDSNRKFRGRFPESACTPQSI